MSILETLASPLVKRPVGLQNGIARKLSPEALLHRSTDQSPGDILFHKTGSGLIMTRSTIILPSCFILTMVPSASLGGQMAFQVQVVFDFHTFEQRTLLCNTDVGIPSPTFPCLARTSPQQQRSRAQWHLPPGNSGVGIPHGRGEANQEGQLIWGRTNQHKPPLGLLPIVTLLTGFHFTSLHRRRHLPPFIKGKLWSQVPLESK